MPTVGTKVGWLQALAARRVHVPASDHDTHAGTCEPRAHPWALRMEVSVPCSRTSAARGKRDGGNAGFLKSDTRRETQGERDAQTGSSYVMHPERIRGCVTRLTRAHRCPASVPRRQPEVPAAPLPPPRSCPRPRQRGERGQPRSAARPAAGMVYVTLSSHACENTPWI